MDVYFKLSSGAIGYACWSSNGEPVGDIEKYNGTIGLYVFDTDGTDMDGCELDVYDDRSIKEHLAEALELAGYEMTYEIITEDEYEETLEQYQNVA